MFARLRNGSHCPSTLPIIRAALLLARATGATGCEWCSMPAYLKAPPKVS